MLLLMLANRMLLQVDWSSREILISQIQHLTPVQLKMDIYREMIQQLRATNQYQCSLQLLSGQVMLPLLLLQSPLTEASIHIKASQLPHLSQIMSLGSCLILKFQHSMAS
uniref:Uncharacterized protein n=1 Tax=Opuntia streptacantha TaxID=393608 RepID=A0A7C8ZWG5_OPUST